MAFLRGRSVYCIPLAELPSEHRLAFSYVCLTTATLSSFGAVLQLINWSKRLKSSEQRRIPSPTPHIVFSLALADLFACIGVIGMSVLFITFKPAKHDKHNRYTTPGEYWYWYVGVPIESFTMFSYVSSYMWTLMYSVDICLQIHNKHESINGITYQVISWLTAAWLVGCGQFGFMFNSYKHCSTGKRNTLHYMVCYVPLLIVMALLPCIYWKAYKRVAQNIKRAGYFTNAERSLQKSVRKRFFLIVFVFFFCWIANCIDGFHDIHHIADNSLSDEANHFDLWMFEAVVNPLQGFLNCFVYGQHKQFTNCCTQSCCTPSREPKESPITPDTDFSTTVPVTPSDEWQINSFSKRVVTPYSESSPLLGDNSSHTESVDSSRAPFAVKLLGEFARQHNN